MKKTVLTVGLVGGAAVALLSWMQYRLLVLENAVELYAALVAILFAGVGLWMGSRLSRKPGLAASIPETITPPPIAPFRPREAAVANFGLTPREVEILEHVAQGLTNKEIAERLFVSENTVKTHCSRVFDKLGARRRTDAVRLGQQAGLLP